MKGHPTAAYGFPWLHHQTVAQMWAPYQQSGLIRHLHGREPDYVAPKVADRSPCFRCGVRADVGCEHRA